MIKLKVLPTIAIIAVLSITAQASNNKQFLHADKAIKEGISTNSNFSGVVSLHSLADDKRTKYYATGFSNQIKKIDFNENTVVDIGSLTKQFTGAAIVRLVSNGKLSYLDRLGKHISGLKPELSNLTLHHLLTHTSGVTDETGDDYESFTLDALIKQLNSQPLKFQIGTYQYSNIGYSLLTAVIEKVSGQTYESYLSEEFFKPLGMSKTGYQLPKYIVDEVAIGYGEKEIWGQPHTKNWDSNGPYWNLRGNGGLLSTVSDLEKWIKALHGNGIFNQENKQALFGRYVQEYNDMLSFYGYGWVSEDITNTNELIWHNGSNGVFTAEIRYYPQNELFFIAVSNKATSPVWQITEPLHEAIAIK